MDVSKSSIAGSVLCYELKEGKTPECLSYALITTIEGTPSAILWHIHTQKHLRKRGLAAKLLNSLKEEFTAITTGLGTQEGNRLCMTNGFVREGETLVWRKK